MSNNNEKIPDITTREGLKGNISNRPGNMDDILRKQMEEDFLVSQRLLGEIPPHNNIEKVSEEIPPTYAFPKKQEKKDPESGKTAA